MPTLVSEVCHRLMLVEAVDAGLIRKPSAADLRRRRTGIQRLTRYWALTSQILNLNFVVVPLDDRRLRRGQQARADYGLLTNDSLIVAAAQEYGINYLASRDEDFDRIPELVVCMPSDIP